MTKFHTPIVAKIIETLLAVFYAYLDFMPQFSGIKSSYALCG
jgi:hypothetical protein